VGRVPHSYPLGNKKYSEALCPYVLDFEGKEELISLSTHRPVKVNYDGYWKSAHKMDYPLEFKPDVYHQLALKFASEYCGGFYECKSSPIISVEWDKSPGYPWRYLGCRNKEDAFRHRDFKDVEKAMKTPIWTLSGKGEEKLDIVDLLDDKMRTFQIAPLELVLKQKRLFTIPQKRMIRSARYHWIKYGISLQYGGAQEFFASLSKFNLRWESDVSGWDRKLQIMRDVYKIKREHMFPHLTDSEKVQFKYVEDAVCESVFLTHDGSLFQRKCGNPSGSGSTTEDNCVAHVIIVFRLFIKLYFEYYGRMPTLSDILANVDVGLFGDDNTGGCNSEFFGIENELHFSESLIANYSFYSLVVKPKACSVELGVGDCKVSFLGLRCLGAPHYNYIPNIAKILSSITYGSKHDSFSIVCVRAIAIYRLLRYSTMRGLVKRFITHLKSQSEDVSSLKVTEPAIYAQLYDIDGPLSLYDGRENL